LEIYKDFTFEAAHCLPNVPEGHKCRRLHGHSYRVRVFVAGPLDSHAGWVVDFADIKAACKPIFDQLDHYYLNEIAGLENPTAERIAEWLWTRIKPVLPQLVRIEIAETCTSGSVYAGPDAG
jgi:6-pyruvoyltetrahydropterin/6-carboxytetrahydropterin synthase